MNEEDPVIQKLIILNQKFNACGTPQALQALANALYYYPDQVEVPGILLEERVCSTSYGILHLKRTGYFITSETSVTLEVSFAS